MQIGCHSNCGVPSFDIDDCREPLRRGYACITTDMGHRGDPGSALWAFNNPQAEIDWAYRSTHLVAVVGKALAHHYYGAAPTHAYFAGWSAGTRQAVVEAQRYPEDFDGIIAGSGQIDWTGAMMNAVWISTVMLDPAGKPIFSTADFQLLHDAVLAHCDRDDGLKDGIITNPPKCDFDPVRLLCSRNSKARCLTRAQVNAANKLYSGPMNSSGEVIYQEGALLRGSELSWQMWQGLGATLGIDVLRYAGFSQDRAPGWGMHDFDFDADPQKLKEMEALYSGKNPDLRRFRAAGGKMIFWQGWSEVPGPPLSVTRYYEAVEKLMGGRTETQGFFRLFMIPGLTHELGLKDGFSIPSMDLLTQLENWVEKGIAPDKLTGRYVKRMRNEPLQTLYKPSADDEDALFTRPIYPYPTFARYKGRGDPDRVESFSP